MVQYTVYNYAAMSHNSLVFVENFTRTYTVFF